ncbi:hypothetical protein [Caballeronia sp. GAWG1-5s-s]|uniref:hypothetical protein n=1 Tax=Caballeronia sp. GAWG1-5s-s TaxID=2921743 RepID=UPI002027DABA|nr:hypothetical protein [Caballeronia sp. GAWG1-5s-s]
MERRDEYRPLWRFAFELFNGTHQDLGDGIQICPRFALANIAAEINALIDEFLDLRAEARPVRAAWWQTKNRASNFSANAAIGSASRVEQATHAPRQTRKHFDRTHGNAADDKPPHAMLSQGKPFFQRGTQSRHEELFLKHGGAGPRPCPALAVPRRYGSGEETAGYAKRSDLPTLDVDHHRRVRRRAAACLVATASQRCLSQCVTFDFLHFNSSCKLLNMRGPN